ncbi:cytochrome c-type biogenesis protein CcsB [Desulfosalsimonas propionicica]|uniref:Cytochrome c-type biogenesis protein CcsB n=1 Tax=Desulfosalsimonas propionicica TaxID=332175 RepID=A0A7W0CA37_9BACT|nr:c-type cytochrome biogenesis protein CcsB [Desulfosalsimonas propionicica]MBA2881966.1 cytochrome c-type biogenesis protein CcsB [Desulfosalsimonas propionicica]
MPNSETVFTIVTFVYGLAFILYVAAWIFKKSLPGKTATGVLIAAAAGNAAGFVLRWAESHQMGYGYVPLSNLYESLVFFALCIAVIYLVVEYRYKVRTIGVFASIVPFLAMAYASLPSVDSQIQPLIPALQSNWLIAHVITCFLGYAAFAIACGISIMYLIKSASASPDTGTIGRFPDAETMDELTHQMIAFGFLLLSVGIITGAIWADQAWGRYWGWDPKETWSLITWLIYATLLHARFMRGWEGRRIAYLSCLGFVAVLFTYFGVNLLPGLHSYQ